jgi:Rhodopirellula transposase DDE domain
LPTWGKKKENVDPTLMEDIEAIIAEHSQIDPSFKSQICYIRVTAKYIFDFLILKKGALGVDFCTRTVNNILNRTGYTLRKVLKTKPFKKIAETDAIFENVAAQHAIAASNPRILRISMDVKAKVKIGNFSRGGLSRLKETPQTLDHDFQEDALLVPFGIYELNTDRVFLTFGNSIETADFIMDSIEKWWQERGFAEKQYDLLMIDLDNGKAVASNTRKFIDRMVSFAAQIQMPIQLVYYPPYHSKYNPIERVWAALENYWKPTVLKTIDLALQIAGQMTWKLYHPVVSLMNKVYPKKVTLSDEAFEKLNPFLKRNPLLKKWDVRILNPSSG